MRGWMTLASPRRAVPYGVSAQAWSDGAEKQRWMAIPDGEVVTVDAEHQLIPGGHGLGEELQSRRPAPRDTPDGAPR